MYSYTNTRQQQPISLPIHKVLNMKTREEPFNKNSYKEEKIKYVHM